MALTVFLGASAGIVAAYIYTVPLLFTVFRERAELAGGDPDLVGTILVSLAYGVFGFMVSVWFVAPFGGLLALAARFSSHRYGSRTAAITTGVVGVVGGILFAAGVDGAGIADGPSLYVSLAAYCGCLAFLGGYYCSNLLSWLARRGLK